MSGFLKDGQWQEGWYDTGKTAGEFVRTASKLRNRKAYARQPFPSTRNERTYMRLLSILGARACALTHRWQASSSEAATLRFGSERWGQT